MPAAAPMDLGPEARLRILKILLKTPGFQDKPTSWYFLLLWPNESLVSFEFKKISRSVYFYTRIVD